MFVARRRSGLAAASAPDRSAAPSPWSRRSGVPAAGPRDRVLGRVGGDRGHQTVEIPIGSGQLLDPRLEVLPDEDRHVWSRWPPVWDRYLPLSRTAQAS
jgi:hypothetical protein